MPTYSIQIFVQKSILVLLQTHRCGLYSLEHGNGAISHDPRTYKSVLNNLECSHHHKSPGFSPSWDQISLSQNSLFKITSSMSKCSTQSSVQKRMAGKLFLTWSRKWTPHLFLEWCDVYWCTIHTWISAYLLELYFDNSAVRSGLRMERRRRIRGGGSLEDLSPASRNRIGGIGIVVTSIAIAIAGPSSSTRNLLSHGCTDTDRQTDRERRRRRRRRRRNWRSFVYILCFKLTIVSNLALELEPPLKLEKIPNLN